ncbi:hypothetical protein C2E25_14265 [Geothermobacter hydrogeniphilus]|uniref:DNA methylase N-4/N-6 domain-containing protein n=1 Tax=Geothermobacter hydrogeniphilus TaxID=1969733 RepID=A0A2K2H707_9BACT|nr:site-specific DNA-methyltransferase [Geothermobacter hydrogeniphilus]PNU19096.1 hypothetical protein C2E25_14265 [Geothermobacter hydrogeniphilus]
MSEFNAFDQLRDFLKGMFQFEDHDLDFGIYRIIRLKRKFIESFIDGEGEESLRATVMWALGSVQNSQSDAARNWLSAFAATLGKKGEAKWETLVAAPDNLSAQDDFRALLVLADDQEREQAEAHLKTFLETRQLSTEDLEVRVYNHLLNFFELYYQNGDFGYNTRAASAFKVPYETDYDGSDTLFHWKHKDSYYIKTGNGFHSVRCEIGGKWIEFRLCGSEDDAETSERNNNKENAVKQYRLLDIQPVEETDAEGNPRTLWQVRFALAAASTPKTVLYPRLWQEVFAEETELIPYLYKKPGKNDDPPGKPLFNELSDDYDKTDGGSVKGIGQLRLKFDKYVEALAGRDEFKDLGKNVEARKEALAQDATAKALWQLDRNLNKFYVGNDADYFIHKDLLGFLTREKNRFIKQVIFSDLDALLHAGEDNATVLIARAFNQVADRLIAFLSAIEEFQKGLFELKKKVVDTHYLISVGKIPEAFHERVFACEAQREEWREVFKVDITDAAQLAEHPTLVVDTSLYLKTDPDFQDDLLSLPEFDNLDEQTDGLLINSENWQALNLLQEKFREQIKCIYIDPPYNTGGDGFLYKDSFRHSSWASMMFDRLQLASFFLDMSGLILCSINEKEQMRLQEVLSILFRKGAAAPFVWKRKAGGGDDSETHVIEHEYIFPAFKNIEQVLVNRIEHESAAMTAKYNRSENGRRYYLERLDKTSLSYSESMDFPIEAPDGKLLYPPQPSPDRRTTIWRWSKDKVEKERDQLIFNKDKKGNWQIYTKTWEPDQRGVTPRSLLVDAKRYGRNRDGTQDLARILGPKLFKNPKPVKLISELLDMSTAKHDFVVDFFAGSGTTGQAVLSKKDPRRFILIEMGKYFESILKPRVKRAVYSTHWKDCIPASNDVQLRCIKVQILEQYEDLLDNLVPVWDEATLPKQVPVSYLFRPEQNQLATTLDLARPFSQTLRIGKAREVKTIDLMETWCYLQGYWVKSRRLYREFDRPYLAVETTHGTLVVFRDIDDAEDDTANLNAILARYVDAQGVSTLQRLEVNHDADLRCLAIDTILITAADFMRGASW